MHGYDLHNIWVKYIKFEEVILFIIILIVWKPNNSIFLEAS